MTRKRSQAVIKLSLFSDIRRMIEEARSAVAVTVNAGLTILYWQIGVRINHEILKGGRAEYGEEIVATLSRQLVERYGRGFAEKNLRRMVQFAESFPDAQIVAALSRQLSWSHFKELLPLKQPLQSDFYAEMCRIENWSVRTLRKKIDGMLYERTALSKKPEKLVRQQLKDLREEDKVTADLVFKDPYFLDFLGLRGAYAEKDLETAILGEIEKFLLEMGAGFAFIERQKRIVIDSEDFYLDLLLYNRRLKRLVLVELKLGKFKAAHKGQMELYLRWLEKYEMEPEENTPLGLILCAEGGHEQIELLQLDKAGVRVAKYLTELPPRRVLERQLHQAVEQAKQTAETEATPRRRRATR
ncbi:MAG: PDDEXK nuclease domain-containing protein [Blastocatellia bacterium]